MQETKNMSVSAGPLNPLCSKIINNTMMRVSHITEKDDESKSKKEASGVFFKGGSFAGSSVGQHDKALP